MIDSILAIINKVIPDETAARDAAVQLEREYTRQMEQQSSIIQAELRNGSGKWRVRLMYLCMFFVFAHWVMYELLPYLDLMFELELFLVTPTPPPHVSYLWDFMKLGVTGYVASRGVEKSVAWWKNGK